MLMRGVLVGAAPRAARNRNTAKCGVKRLRGARGAPPTSEGKSTYFIAGAISSRSGLLLQFISPHTAEGRQKPLCAARSYGNKSQGQIACDFLLACLAGSVHHCLSADVARFQVKPVMSHSYSQSAAFAALACYSPSSGVQSSARTFSAAGCSHSPGTGHLELL